MDDNRIEAIEKFLQDWKQKAFLYYTNLKKEMTDKKKEQHPITRENLSKLTVNSWSSVKKYSDEQIEKILNEIDTMPKYMIEKLLSNITYQEYKKWEKQHTKAELIICEKAYNDIELNKILDKEVISRRKKLIHQVEKKAGKIVDVSNLYWGLDAGINGTIIGELKTVKVETIYAGGYNIQCLHYRVLIKG